MYCLIPDIIEIIFLELSGKDMIALSSTSRYFYDIYSKLFHHESFWERKLSIYKHVHPKNKKFHNSKEKYFFLEKSWHIVQSYIDNLHCVHKEIKDKDIYTLTLLGVLDSSDKNTPNKV